MERLLYFYIKMKGDSSMNPSDLKCPKCGANSFNEKYTKDNLFVCINKDDEGCACGAIVAIYCKECEKIIEKDDLGLRGDVYECKECGTPHWGYTEYSRDRAARQKEIQDAVKQLEDLNNSLLGMRVRRRHF